MIISFGEAANADIFYFNIKQIGWYVVKFNFTMLQNYVGSVYY